MVEQSITCCRCDGMMIETYSDLLSPSEKGEDEFGWRCANCGDYIDRQVLARSCPRALQRAGMSAWIRANDWIEPEREI